MGSDEITGLEDLSLEVEENAISLNNTIQSCTPRLNKGDKERQAESAAVVE